MTDRKGIKRNSGMIIRAATVGNVLCHMCARVSLCQSLISLRFVCILGHPKCAQQRI